VPTGEGRTGASGGCHRPLQAAQRELDEQRQQKAEEAARARAAAQAVAARSAKAELRAAILMWPPHEPSMTIQK